MAWRSNADIDDEDMVDISDWTDGDSGTGDSSQVTFDGKSCMKLDTGATEGGSAQRYQDIGSFGTRTVFSMNVYCDLIGTLANVDIAQFQAHDGSSRIIANWDSDGLFIYDGASYIEVGTDLVVQDTWQEWTFDVNWTAQTVDVYLDGILKASGVDCSAASATAEGTVYFFQYGTTTTNQITYVDWFKAGSTLVEFSPFSREFTDTFTPTDTLTKSVAYKRTFLETLTPSESYSDLSTLVRLFLESVTLSEDFVKSYGTQKSFLDSVTLSDLISYIQGKGRTFLDSITISDVMTKLVAYGKEYTDTITLTDLLNKVLCRNFIFNETITLSEDFDTAGVFTREFTDVIRLVDNDFSPTEAGETIIEISKDPQISAGEKHGDLLTIHHILNLPKLRIRNGTGISLYGGGNYVMGSGDVLSLVYRTDNSTWSETSRGKYMGGM